MTEPDADADADADERFDPLHAALARLVRDGTLSDAQARRVAEEMRTAGLGAATTGAHAGRSAAAVEVLSYLGAALVVGGLTLVVGLSWASLGLTGRLATCTAITALLLAVAALVGRWSDAPFGPRRHVVASVLAVLASVAAGIAALQLPRALTDAGRTIDGGLWGAVAFGAAMTVVGMGAYLAWRAAPSLVAMFGGGLVVLMGVLTSTTVDVDDWGLVELALFCYGAVWAVAARLFGASDTGAVLGGIAAATGAEMMALAGDHTLFGLGLGVLALGGMFALFWRTRRWWYAAIGVLTTLVVPPTAVAQTWHDGTLAAVVVLVIGVLLVVVALLAARRRRTPS